MGQAASYINAEVSQPAFDPDSEGHLLQHEGEDPAPHGHYRNHGAGHAGKRRGAHYPAHPRGTDGARLSFMGLPCPNICTGGANAHGKLEYVVLEDMEKIKDIIKTAVYNVE